MTARQDLARSVEDAEHDIDRLFGPISSRIGATLLKRAQGPSITHIVRRAAMRDIDQLLATIYGSRRGRSSPLEDAISRRANDAALKPIVAEVIQIEKRLAQHPDLLEAMRGASTDEETS